MQRYQAFKYALMPTGSQQRAMRRCAGSCRFVYNKSRDVLGEVRQVTVSPNGGKWFVSIQTEREVEQPHKPPALLA